MKVAALYDIHGNLPALEAVIDEVRREQVDQVVIGGDVLPGPMPRECIDCLLALDLPVQFIQGNGEVAALAAATGKPANIPVQAREAVYWTAQQLCAEDLRTVANWPKTIAIEIPGLGEVLFCHATPRDENEIFTRDTDVSKLLPIFANVDAELVICGHTHMQFDRAVGNVRVVNAGSVGMPFGEPGAYWCLLGPDVQLRRTHCDLVQAADRIRQTNYPQAEDFASHNILQPPSEAQMMALFSRAEVKLS